MGSDTPLVFFRIAIVHCLHASIGFALDALSITLILTPSPLASFHNFDTWGACRLCGALRGFVFPSGPTFFSHMTRPTTLDAFCTCHSPILLSLWDKPLHSSEFSLFFYFFFYFFFIVTLTFYASNRYGDGCRESARKPTGSVLCSPRSRDTRCKTLMDKEPTVNRGPSSVRQWY